VNGNERVRVLENKEDDDQGAVVDREIAEDDHDQETRNLDDQEVGTGDHDQESPTGEIEDQDPILMRNAEKSVKKKNVKTNRKLKKLQKKLVSRCQSFCLVMQQSKEIIWKLKQSESCFGEAKKLLKSQQS